MWQKIKVIAIFLSFKSLKEYLVFIDWILM